MQRISDNTIVYEVHIQYASRRWSTFSLKKLRKLREVGVLMAFTCHNAGFLPMTSVAVLVEVGVKKQYIIRSFVISTGMGRFQSEPSSPKITVSSAFRGRHELALSLVVASLLNCVCLGSIMG
jgi:hypothetical protein